MADIDEYATSLLEQAKRFLEKEGASSDTDAKSAYRHACVLLAFCSLEAHVNAIAQELATRPEFTVHEKALLLEQDVKLDRGSYSASGFKMTRLEDRIAFLYRHFDNAPFNKAEEWWSSLAAAQDVRNKLTHPKEKKVITRNDAENALLGVIKTIDKLYKKIYKKPLPSANRSLNSRLDF